MLIYLLALTAFFALVIWRPPTISVRAGIRGYLLRLLGFGLTLVGLRWCFVHTGHFELANDRALFTVLAGLALVLAGLVPDSAFVDVFGHRWPWNTLPPGWDRVTVVLLGVLFGTVGGVEMRHIAAAIAYCDSRTTMANTPSLDGNEGALVPDSTLHPLWTGHASHAYTCSELRQP